MSQEIAKIEQSGVSGAIVGLNSGQVSVYSSIKGDDFATKVAVLNATTNSVAIADNLGKTINLVNVIVQAIDMEDESTGEVVEVPRTILIDVDGTAYHAVSQGVFKALENLLGILGEPSTWPGAVPITVTKEGKKPREYFTIRLA